MSKILFNPKMKIHIFICKIYNFEKNDNQEEKICQLLLNPKNEEAVMNLVLLKIRKSNYEETKINKKFSKYM